MEKIGEATNLKQLEFEAANIVIPVHAAISVIAEGIKRRALEPYDESKELVDFIPLRLYSNEPWKIEEGILGPCVSIEYKDSSLISGSCDLTYGACDFRERELQSLFEIIEGEPGLNGYYYLAYPYADNSFIKLTRDQVNQIKKVKKQLQTKFPKNFNGETFVQVTNKEYMPVRKITIGKIDNLSSRETEWGQGLNLHLDTKVQELDVLETWSFLSMIKWGADKDDNYLFSFDKIGSQERVYYISKVELQKLWDNFAPELK